MEKLLEDEEKAKEKRKLDLDKLMNRRKRLKIDDKFENYPEYKMPSKTEIDQ